jgi:hypothetical protein
MEPSQRGFQVEPTTDGSKWNPQPAVPLGTVLVQLRNHLEVVPHRIKKRCRLWDSAKNPVWFHIERFVCRVYYVHGQLQDLSGGFPEQMLSASKHLGGKLIILMIEYICIPTNIIQLTSSLKEELLLYRENKRSLKEIQRERQQNCTARKSLKCHSLKNE